MKQMSVFGRQSAFMGVRCTLNKQFTRRSIRYLPLTGQVSLLYVSEYVCGGPKLFTSLSVSDEVGRARRRMSPNARVTSSK